MSGDSATPAGGEVRDFGDGALMPVLGLGVWQLADGREAEQAVEWALETGYRHVDTATTYRKSAASAQRSRAAGFLARSCS